MNRFTLVLVAVSLAVAVAMAGTATAGPIQDALQAYWDFDAFDTATVWPGGVPHAGNFQAGTKGIFDDVSPNNNPLYAGNSQQVTVPYQAAAGKFGGAFYGDNSGANSTGAVAIALHSSDIDFGKEDFTISFWEKSTQYRGNGAWGTQKHRGVMIAKFKDTATDKLGWRFGLEQANYGLRRDGTRGSNTNILTWNYSGNATLQDGDPPHDGFFGHYVITYDASAEDLRIYENGVQKAEDLAYDATAFSSDSNLSIGGPLAFGISTSGSFGFQGMLTGLSGASDPAWVDDTAMLGITFTAGEVMGTFNLGDDAGLQYDLGDVIPLLDVHRDTSGNADVGALRWSYATGLSGADGQLTGGGTAFTLVLDSAAGTGLTSAPVPEPSTIALAGLALLGLLVWRQRK